MLQPTRSIFWRFILIVTFLLVISASWDLINLAGQLSVQILSRPSWLGALIALGLLAAVILFGYLLSFSKSQDQLWTLFEAPANFIPRQPGFILSFIGLVGFSSITYLKSFKQLLGAEDWIRLLIFWSFSLLGMWGIKTIRRETTWLNALIAIVLSQTTLHLLLSYWSQVTSYPFSMGWSETSRYYFPSLFVAQGVYGQKFPLPILHPTLHLLLTLPYLFHAPLWFHRFWQVALRYVLIAVVVPAMMKRISIQDKKVWWPVAAWIFLFMFIGPIYLHLTIPVILILLGFSLRSDRRTWFVILAASAYCGWSRVNWYPVPALMAAVLYVLETPLRGKSLWQYLWKPALWGVVGTLTAFAFQRLYIALSGVTDSQYFYTSISSTLLWYRLLPNVTYPSGLLLAVIFASLPMWLVIYLVFRSRKKAFHPLRIALLLSALLVLFIGGLVVSLKIGGGADIHNMDAYFVVLLIIFMYLVFAKYFREDGELDQPMQLHWLNGITLLVPVVWFLTQPNIGFVTYNAQRTQTVLEALQQRVDQVNMQGGEILFITQRQLISMNMLHGVKLIPEYEREDLMEMAMGDNQEYLDKFKTDLQNQRFALIIVDPLKYKLLGKNYPFGEENNVWVSRAMKPILCNYQQAAIFPEDDIALYVPQTGTRQCP